MSLAAPALAALLAAAPSLERVDAARLERLVEENRGRLVWINVWATWCPPCLEEFPDIVAVERAYRDRGLVVVSVSADRPERAEEDLVPFLERHRPGFPVYLLDAPDPEAFARALDPEWDGSLPASFFVGRDGRMLLKRYGRMRRAEMERLVRALVDD